MYTPTDELMLHSQRAFDICRDQVYNYEDCRQLDYYGTPNPALCSKESLDLLKCYNKAEEIEPICMHAFRKYKECNFQYGGAMVYCEKEMNEFNLCQDGMQKPFILSPQKTFQFTLLYGRDRLLKIIFYYSIFKL